MTIFTIKKLKIQSADAKNEIGARRESSPGHPAPQVIIIVDLVSP